MHTGRRHRLAASRLGVYRVGVRRGLQSTNPNAALGDLAYSDEHLSESSRFGMADWRLSHVEKMGVILIFSWIFLRIETCTIALVVPSLLNFSYIIFCQ